jgi:hypothetical protein
MRAYRRRIRIETPPVSWLGGLSRSWKKESEQQRGLPIPATNRVRFAGRISGTRRKLFSALQSRGGDGISPSSRARSLQ